MVYDRVVRIQDTKEDLQCLEEGRFDQSKEITA